MKYIKKPIPIEISEPWFQEGDHPKVKPALNIYPGTNPNSECPKCHKYYFAHGQIETLEGWHIVCPGDRIVTGVQGEQYPIKPDIFEQTYEPAQDKEVWLDRLYHLFLLILGIANAIRFWYEPSWWSLAMAIFFVVISIVLTIQYEIKEFTEAQHE